MIQVFLLIILGILLILLGYYLGYLICLEKYWDKISIPEKKVEEIVTYILSEFDPTKFNLVTDLPKFNEELICYDHKRKMYGTYITSKQDWYDQIKKYNFEYWSYRFDKYIYLNPLP